jgi:hypothetical protein
MAVYFGRPAQETPSTQPSYSLNQLAGWVMTLKAMGVIPREGRVVADIIATLPMLAKRPYAVALMDITARKLKPGSYRLNSMQAALLIDTHGAQLAYDRRIRDLLTTYTDADKGTIEALEADGVRYHRLTDRRLPGWAVMEWGTVGNLLIVTLGDGAFEKILDPLVRQSPSLGDNPWYKRAHLLCNGEVSRLEVYVDIAQILARLNEVIVGRPENVLRALGLENNERLLLTFGFEGRAMRCEVFTQDRNRSRGRYLMLVGKDLADEKVLVDIPHGATSYAVFRLGLTDAYHQGKQAYLVSQSASVRQRLSDGWARMEQQFDINLETGLLDQLGDHLVIHTYPAHPLGLPVLCSIWIQHTGDRESVSQTVERLMTAWQYYMYKPPATRPASILTPRLNRAPDGVWFLQLGLIGPAVAVADEWIIISYSPHAVRTNLNYLQTLPTQTQTQPE